MAKTLLMQQQGRTFRLLPYSYCVNCETMFNRAVNMTEEVYMYCPICKETTCRAGVTEEVLNG